MRSVFVSQLSARVADRELTQFFEAHAGKVRDAKVIVDRISRRSKGCARCRFECHVLDIFTVSVMSNSKSSNQSTKPWPSQEPSCSVSPLWCSTPKLNAIVRPKIMRRLRKTQTLSCRPFPISFVIILTQISSRAQIPWLGRET